MVSIAPNSDRHRQLKTINKLSVVLGTTPHIGPAKGISSTDGQTTPSHSKIHSRLSINIGTREIALHCTSKPFSIRRKLKNLCDSVTVLGRGHNTRMPAFKSSPPHIISTPTVNFLSSSNPDKPLPSTPISSPLSPFSANTGSFNSHLVSPHRLDELETSPMVLFSQERFDKAYEQRRRVEKMAKLRRYLGECPPTELVFKTDFGKGAGEREGDKKTLSFSEYELQPRAPTYSLGLPSQNTLTVVQEIGQDRMDVGSRGQLMRTLRSM